MTVNEPASERNLDGYDAPLIPWAKVRERLDLVEGAVDPEDPEFSAPAAGPPPWHVYEVTPKTVFALGTAEPFGAMRFRF
jgi:hypothetical protein